MSRIQLVTHVCPTSPKAAARFRASHETQGGCWVWTALRDQFGYGRFTVGRTTFYAHRVAYEMHVGPIPHKSNIVHTCKNKSCVNPSHLTATNSNTLERFKARYRVVDGCWIWDNPGPNGYGYLKVNQRSRSAHIFSYEHHFGPVPEGLELDHLCKNKACVNPAHLEAVTHTENVRRGPSRNASDLCRSCGRPYDQVVVNAKGHVCRRCLPCKRTKEQLRRAALEGSGQ